MQIQKLLQTYGRAVTAHTGAAEPLAYHAFIQPLRYKNKLYLYGVNTEIGYNSQGHYLYIGPPEPDLSAWEDDACLQCGGVKYRVDRAEGVYLGNRLLYVWAIIRSIVEIGGGLPV